MPVVEYDNTNLHYYTNAINKMYFFTEATGKDFNSQETGWHFIPNQIYSNWLTPRQWFDLITNHDKFRLVSCEATVQNEIPLTDNLAIGQDTTFMTFNNTIYGLGYTDKHYETAPVESVFDLTMREGIIVDDATGNITGKTTLPLYNHPLCKKASEGQPNTYAYYAWDPFIHANQLMELRPGKNAIQFKWEAHSSDADKWYSTAEYYGLQINNDTSNVPKRSTNQLNFINTWMAPGQLMKEDPRTIDFKNKVANIYKWHWNYPITNWFLKMIPLVDTKNNLLKHQGNIVIHRKIRFEVTPRTNTTNYPQIQAYYANQNRLLLQAGTKRDDRQYDMAYRPVEYIGKEAPSDNMDTAPYITTAATSHATVSRKK